MTLRERIDALGGDYEDQPPWEREIDALRAELERQKAHNKLQQSTLHELHARMKTKDAENERLRSELSEAYERAAKYVAAQAKKALGRKFTVPEDVETVLMITADAIRALKGVKA